MEYLIKAIEIVKAEHGEELNLLLGGGEGKSITNQSQHYQYIQVLAKKSPVSKNIRFLGIIESIQLPTYYSLAEVVALPYIMRGKAFGAVLLEALACGTPIIASDLPAVKDVINGNNNIGTYVSARNSCMLSKALVKTAYIKDKVTEASWQFVVRTYAAEKIAKTYLQLYRALN